MIFLYIYGASRRTMRLHVTICFRQRHKQNRIRLYNPTLQRYDLLDLDALWSYIIYDF